MTPEQITMLLQILQNTPLQLLLMLAIYVAYRDVKSILITRLDWLSKELSSYMQRDREIVSEIVRMPRVPVASKWESVPPTHPPAPG